MLFNYLLLIKFVVIISNTMPCSFCSQNGHTILNCNDPTIDSYYRRLKSEYISQYTLNRYEHERQFKNLLNRRYNLRELRAVAIKYTVVARATNNKPEIIHLIWNHFNREVLISNNSEEWQRISRIPTTLDNIPTFAQDLNEDFDNTGTLLDWTVDRTPIPIEEAQEEYLNIQFTYDYNNWLMNMRETIQPTTNFSVTLNLEEEEEESNDRDDCDCAICYETMTDYNKVTLNCKHKFCCVCIKHSLKTYNRQICALCRTVTTSYDVKHYNSYNIIAENRI